MGVMAACYDLSKSPPTYDYVSFLLDAECERLRRNDETLTVTIKPGERKGSIAPHDPAWRKMMLAEVVMPMAKLLPSCTSCEVGESDPGAFGYQEAHFGTKNMLNAARKGVYPFRSSAANLGYPYVTITLRECSYWPERNSNIDEWRKVGHWLKAHGHHVIFIRDTEQAHSVFADFAVCPGASRDLLTRAELYAGAKLNLFVNNGPAWLCLFMGAPCAIFNLAHAEAREAFYEWAGHPKGSTWPNLRPGQLVSWELDRADKIIESLHSLTSLNGSTKSSRQSGLIR